MPRQLTSLTLADARRLIGGAKAKAQELGVAYNLAVVDVGGALIAQVSQSGKPLFGIRSTNHERVVIFAGGRPVKIGDLVIGGVGASGGTVDQDQKVVEAAVAALEES